MSQRFHKVLVANRGEIARRILRTCHAEGYATVAVYSDADADAPFVREADEAIRLGPAPAADSYLDPQRILRAARHTGAGAVHPGYGFLAENAAFAQAVEDAGLVFIGPAPATLAAMGSKVAAKDLMRAHGVPVIPGWQPAAGGGAGAEEQETEALAERAMELGLAHGHPVLIKASAGGGGKGMRVVREAAELAEAIKAARREAEGAFGDGTLLLERYLERPRHIEFQILGDEHGGLVHLFERECSIQRRHQKIVEETPSMAFQGEGGERLRARMAQAALTAGRALGYRSAGTVEMLLDASGDFYFLEVNTRLQVEHPVTEETTGLDLVALQLRVAQGEALPFAQDGVTRRGHAIECRLYAEDPARGFLPSTGRLADWRFVDAPGVRLDSGVEVGDAVSVHYDPMLAKLIAWGPDRATATRRMVRALERASIAGVTTNRDQLLSILTHPAWAAGELDTHFLERHLPSGPPGAPSTEGALASSPPASSLAGAALAAAVATVSLAHERGAGRPLPSVPLGWRNNRWRDAEERWRVVGEIVGQSPGEGSPGADAAAAELELRYRALADDAFKVYLHAPTTAGAPGGEVTWDVRVVERRDEPGGVASLRLAVGDDGWRAEARVAREGARFYVYGPFSGDEAGPGAGRGAPPRVITLERLDRFPEADEVEDTGGLHAPMPGKITGVLVAQGDAVEEGQTLVTLEAMKMEHTVRAPRAGTVAEVAVAVGEQIDADRVLVTLE